MLNLQTLPARRCLIAGGILIHSNKVLLIKHKKLGIWLNPGGHIDPDELPHHAAEREFWEESGIKVRAVNAAPIALNTALVALNPTPINAPTSHKSHKSSFPQPTPQSTPHSTDAQDLPLPLLINLHWLCEENYHERLRTGRPKSTHRDPTLLLQGCEQHLMFIYLLEPVKGVEFKQNVEETDGIGWFSQEELKDLDTHEHVKSEIEYAFNYLAAEPPYVPTHH